MYKHYLLITTSVLISALLLNLTTCNSVSKKGITEGEIVFNIEYLDSERENPLIALLPRKMITVFKNNSSYSLIQGFYGTFKIINIINYDKKESYSILQILDRKYIYISDINSESFGYSAMGKSKIDFNDKVKIIAGYTCNKATAIYQNYLKETNDTVDIYYANSIKIDNPNSNNPFSEIKGVLMEFTLNMTNINMKFTAEKVNPKKISSEIFNIPKGFKPVSKKELEEVINKFNKKTR